MGRYAILALRWLAKTILPLFSEKHHETPYQYVLRTGKDQGQDNIPGCFRILSDYLKTSARALLPEHSGEHDFQNRMRHKPFVGWALLGPTGGAQRSSNSLARSGEGTPETENGHKGKGSKGKTKGAEMEGRAIRAYMLYMGSSFSHFQPQ